MRHNGGDRARSGTGRRTAAARASTLLGLSVLFGAAMTGQAFSEPRETGRAQDAETRPARAAEPTKVTLCHATGSAANPYVLITIDEHGLNGHDDHEGDIIPAPAGGCPGPEAGPSATTPTTVPTTVPATLPATTVTAAAGPTAPERTVEPAVVPGAAVAPVDARVLSSVQSALVVDDSPASFRLESFAGPVGGATSAIAPAVLGASIERSGGALPRTGGELSALTTCGLGLLALGVALKLAGRPTPAQRRTAGG